MTSPWGSDRLDAGSSFGNYEIVRCLGAGAFGTVYEALRLPFRRRVALKVLHRQHVLNASLVERFLREGEVVARLDHPHIVSVFDLGVHDEQAYLAMEMLQGETLGAALQAEGAMPIEEAVDLMLAVMSGVAAVHDQGVVHRDLKPENIFLARLPTGEAQPKLLDFGIAKVLESDRSLTQSNTMMGTPCYMSPEQARESKNVDAQSDQWSLAVILFELLTGRGPFEGDNLLAVLTAITARPLPRLCEHIPSASEGLEAALLRAMTRTPAGRWPSVREFGAALLPFATAGARVCLNGICPP